MLMVAFYLSGNAFVPLRLRIIPRASESLEEDILKIFQQFKLAILLYTEKENNIMFICNLDLINEIALSKDSPTDKLTGYLMAMGKGISKSKHFRHASHLRDDLYSEILTALLTGYKNFDPLKSSNAFGYLTTIGINAGRLLAKKESNLDTFRKTLTNLARGNNNDV